MAVGTTNATITPTWTAISDQKTVSLHHNGGPDVQIAIGTAAPAESQNGANFKFHDKPLRFNLAASEFVYMRCGTADKTNLPQIIVLQSGYAL